MDCVVDSITQPIVDDATCGMVYTNSSTASIKCSTHQLIQSFRVVLLCYSAVPVRTVSYGPSLPKSASEVLHVAACCCMAKSTWRPVHVVGGRQKKKEIDLKSLEGE